MVTQSPRLDPNVRYRILYEPWQVYKLCAADINASQTAAVTLDFLGLDCEDEWQVVNASANTFAIRSLGYKDESSLLAVFYDNSNFFTSVRLIVVGEKETFPVEGKWILEQAKQGVYRVKTRDNGTDWFLGAVTEPRADDGETVFMEDLGIDLKVIGQWVFVSQGFISSTASATSTTSISSSTSSSYASDTPQKFEFRRPK